ncbi:MAG: hypothetical protein RQ723_12480, partial [Desulfuromonadales bacterium]|nr:hypothetical protein [Desulfuromonadales bacterium]
SKKGTLPSLTFGIGGFGGDGAVSGDVAVNQEGLISTSGESAHGLLAQSIAGGGGNGGLNIAGSINHTSSGATAKPTDLTMVIGIGGNGGAGADAGNVNVVSTGNIETQGDYARGIFAQSIGGGGGNGGMNISTVVEDKGSPIVVGVGGSGSGGGHAGSVTVTRGGISTPAGSIRTSGTSAIGIEASSIGGGGGDAGMNLMFTVSNGGSSSGTSNPYAVQLAIGGAGGVAGNGDTVSVTNYSDIQARGSQSHGILAQSIGGGGGNASFNVGLGYAPNTKAARIVLGGATGDGGTGGAVSVTHQGAISTDGNDAAGIIAQSIGGGGGNAGLDMVFNKTDAAGVSLSLGREGGTGGSGGNVSLSTVGTITTTGRNSYGLLAQSVGNGGGNSSSVSGGFSANDNGQGSPGAAVAVGLEGGVGGVGGNVALDARGSIATSGEKAHAIFAQSIGGGGGNGGTAATVGISAPSVGVSVGGTGGQGAIGQSVTVDNLATIDTRGKGAVGILAQSIGGGGGTGGAAYSGGLKAPGSGVQVTVGGVGGTGADGGRVGVDNSALVTTAGERGHGIVAQSLGGGGGDGGLVINGLINTNPNATQRLFVSVGGDGGTGGVGNAVDVANTGRIATTGKEAVGILAQSIGGGGGSGSTVITGSVSKGGSGSTVGLGIGGTGGTGGTGGNVTVSNLIQDGVPSTGEIHTTGDGAHGIMALSIGGGGGTGSTVVSATVALKPDEKASSHALALSIGGAGGSGGAAGTVTVSNDGSIVTRGAEAHGIVAESIGGGGGNGGMSFAGNLLVGKKTTVGIESAIAIGGSGGTGNTGNDVLVDNSGSIETFGNSSYGILAQSIGGGGGNGATAVAGSFVPTSPAGLLESTFLSVGVGGSGGDGALAGDVTVNHSGRIVTHGDNTYGIYAQSVGGGGGTSALAYSSPFWTAVDFGLTSLLGAKDSSSGIGGNVDINSTGTIVTYGDNSSAINNQAVSSGGGDLRLYLDISQDASSLDQELVDIAQVNSVTENLVASFKGGVGLGGENNQDNAGGSIISSHEGDVMAVGDHSSGLVLQSIGGGGGSAHVELLARTNDAVGLDVALGAITSDNVVGGDVTLSRKGEIVTLGSQGKGVSVQSIGGGGGSLNLTLTGGTGTGSGTSVTLGAIGGAANHGGNLTLDMEGDISTAGDRAQGLMVQSIGAGGGEARLSGTGSADVLLGGQQGATGNGGIINVDNTGAITTQGFLSHGVFLQTIGGGGGAVFTDLDEADIALTLSDQGSGDGGSVRLVQNGSIQTGGVGAFGALVQSIGGGGGTVDRMFTGSAGGGGDAGSLNLTFGYNVATLDDQSVGIFAQSDAAQGMSGTIDVTVNGDTFTDGDTESAGIIAQSTGSLGAGTVNVTNLGFVRTRGTMSRGVEALSQGGTGGGQDVSVTVGGVLLTMGDNSEGVW